MAKLYIVQEVAKWFLSKDSMTQKRLQKLLYYTQAWSYALRNEAFIETSFEAWIHGPVSVDLRNALGRTGLMLIPSEMFGECKNITAPDDLDFLQMVWNTYGALTANALEVLTHRETPWKNARIGCKPMDHCTKKISIDDMKEYYRSIYII